jgi:hypothetical protein
MTSLTCSWKVSFINFPTMLHIQCSIFNVHKGIYHDLVLLCHPSHPSCANDVYSSFWNW